MHSTLDGLRFDNRFVRLLPADNEPRNFRRQVRGVCYSRVLPTPMPAPTLLAYSREMLDELDLYENAVNAQFTSVLAGNTVLDSMDPFAMCYGGHQFGNWAGQLGDGRAINLGEVLTSRSKRWTLQLKGAGPTPYSRTADGLAVLRSSVREFLCSEAMYHLGIPTTRALSLIATGQGVMRDMFYDGHPKEEPGAIVCRVAPSFIRFGNFEIFASRGDEVNLRKLLAIAMLPASSSGPLEWENLDISQVAQWFQKLCQETADMIIGWMSVGFVHGVMNTDNMSIHGLTIDYGPYGWLENYDPMWTPNTTDAHGRRYCYSNQPQIAMWNLVRLAEALMTVFPDIKPLQEGIDLFAKRFRDGWRSRLSEKLGLENSPKCLDESFVDELWEVLQVAEIDMTLFFRNLSKFAFRETTSDTSLEIDSLESLKDGSQHHPYVCLLSETSYRAKSLKIETRGRFFRWLHAYEQRKSISGISESERITVMNRVNPKYVLRNYLAQMAIDRAEQGDPAMITELLDLLREPYSEQPEKESYAARRPSWADNRPGCSMLSCSS